MAPVCEDLFGDLVGVAHAHYPMGSSTHPFETDQRSTAFLPQEHERKQPYFVGAVFGGRTKRVLDLKE